MEKKYIQSEDSATKSSSNTNSETNESRRKSTAKGDGFFRARMRLTFYYALFTAIIVGGFSLILYQTLLSNFADTLRDTAPGLNPQVFGAVIERAHVILANRLFMADAIILFFAVVCGFLLTDRTLKPIRDNMYKQKRFIADASHELRTPIAVVVSGLEVALRNKNLGLDQAKQTLSNTLDEMREFSSLTNQLLDLSKRDISGDAAGGTGNQASYMPIDIADIASSTSLKMKKLADEKEINFNISIPTDIKVRVLGDETELSRVFYNIIHNAITYTPKQGTITVEGHISMGKYVVTVTDTGVGIPAKTLDKIFEPFFQGNASRNHTQISSKGTGAGLGLTLSRKIIESHKGTIIIKSKEHQGTKAVISLPLSS
jgi:signal transduction histidine kinase